MLVDTPIWSLALRRGEHAAADDRIRAKLAELIHQGQAHLLGVVRQEVLSGIREEPQFLRLRDYLRSLPDVPLGFEDYESAAEISNRCRAAGVAGSPVDFLICSVSQRRGWDIFTTDTDFERYGAVVSLKLFGP